MSTKGIDQGLPDEEGRKPEPAALVLIGIAEALALLLVWGGGLSGRGA